MALYHSAFGLPHLRYPTGVIQLIYSDHAMHAARTDKYGSFDDSLPEFLDQHPSDIIEVETTTGGRIKKILYRLRLDDEFDICLAIIPGINLVKTVWLQERNDTHRSLNDTYYCKVQTS